ncbi:Exocyst complex component sec6 [Taphrina deformans PYCC 5710]|uniref:Exocyst complex component sec6 n=1 Tax=Taphrina deformans (strain PYCC 5710 / ATCC 11124 / CBS 356.35 / IMI 108563 / JCM 9778 / NBRC 8474) TaxID=1097556 RepID=R4XBB7_TAPDE|nr:Exocyst complex component sec6 [Taphrina deformans PYCC 5710]|eukprot:CCG80623.1 Exocyst complex component sec6 [Taphrina deformans PYCC 5710]
MTDVKVELDKIEKARQSSQAMVQDFEMINAVSKCHINFVQTLGMVNSLNNMQSTLDTLREQLLDDQASQDQSSPNLLVIHYHLSKLLDFHDTAMRQSTKARKDVQETLKRYFAPLKRFSQEFEAHLQNISSTLLDTLRSGDPSLIVRLAKIIYLEDQNDTKAQTLQDAQKSQKTSDGTSKKSYNAIAGDARALRGYKALFLQSIETSIAEDFKGCSEAFEEPADLLDNLDWIFQDLALVQAELTIRTPRDWDIFKVFLSFYHGNTYHLLNTVLAKNPDGSTILKLLEWVKLYTSTMKTEFDVDVKTLTPKLLDGKDNELIEDYLQLIVKKVEEWTFNLEKTEMASFTNRTEQPEMTPDGIYGMQGAVIMFQMVSQQIDVAADSGQGRVLANVVSECVRIMKDTQSHWLTTLDREILSVERFNSTVKDAEEPLPGLPDYTIALANDQIRSADYCESISARISPLVSTKYSKMIVESLSVATDGFLDLAKSCLLGLIRIIQKDVKDTFRNLFTKEWYGGNSMSLIIGTYREYIQDCRDHLNDLLLDFFLEELLDSFLREYINAMVNNRKATFKIPIVLEHIPGEIGIAFNLFAENMEMSTLQQRFDVLEMVIAFIQTDKTTISEDWHRLKLSCWDARPDVIEGILERRDDLNKKELKLLMEILRRDANIDVEQGQSKTLMGDIFKK